MCATQNGPQVSGSEAVSGSGGGSGDNDREAKQIRKFEAVIIILVGIIGGGFAGVVRRTMDHASYYEAISTGVVGAIVLSGFIIGIIKYIRNQS
ncbi:hypothetical protein [Streptomyces massasporeus]|uniref:hypothetical protein n=1 Tax=Streptomyces massasporeus TaxID=67324 RepID=UPI0016737699|nr:hypothetical protein [Streptomyces massasporeus]GGV64549.1 hypothetical protein GCM10010228_15310 [Streptomyces massasporeus]